MATQIQPFQCETLGAEVDREWKRWKRNFNYFIEANQIIDTERKKTLLLLYAGEQVQETYENLADLNEFGGPRVDGFVDQYKAIMAKLDAHFASKINVTVERHIFHQMKQASDEKMEKFAMRLRAQAKQCSFGDQCDSNIRDRLLAGCNSTEFRREMLKKGNPSLNDVIQSAKITEAVQVQEKAFRKEEAFTQEVAVHKIVQVSKECSRCGSKRHGNRPNDCPALNKECFRCGRRGHFKGPCRSKVSTNQSKGHQGRRFQPYDRVKNEERKDHDSTG